jgi:putative transposase
MRKTEFANGEYYHIYNRGVDKREVFLGGKDYERFLLSIKEFNREDAIGSLYEKYLREKKINRVGESGGGSTSIMEVEPPRLIEIIAYCLNPNHYHIIIKQEQNNSIVKFMQKLGTSYAMYFNKKFERSGVLFQGKFKSIHINSNEYLLLLSAYVNANHEIHGFLEKDWPYSSFLDYTGKRDGKLCNKEIILGQFDNNFGEYEKYIKNNANYFKDKKELEEYILE